MRERESERERERERGGERARERDSERERERDTERQRGGESARDFASDRAWNNHWRTARLLFHMRCSRLYRGTSLIRNSYHPRTTIGS